MNTEENEIEEVSLHDAISEAMDAQEADDGGQPEEGGRPEANAEEPLRDAADEGRERDGSGRFKAKDAKAGGKPDGQPEPVGGSPDEPADPVADLPAPASWKPAIREHWAGLPADVKREVARREYETARVLTETQGIRQQMAEYQQVFQPYEAMIAAEGGTPVGAMKDLLATAAMLRTAPGPTKAARMAQIIIQHGVPIDLLDKALTDPAAQQQMAQQRAPQQPQEPMRDPRLDQLFAYTEQQNKAAARAELVEFRKGHEFVDDLREIMADLMALAEQRNVVLSLEDAYNQAVAATPEISAVLRQREAAAKAQQQKPSAAKRAASSVSGAPTGAPPSQTGTLSRRQAIEAALDEAS